MRKIGLGLLILLFVAGGTFFVLSRRGGEQTVALASDTPSAADDSKAKDEDEEEVRVPVEMVRAQARDLPAYFKTTGSLEARRQVELISKAQGQITVLDVEEGDRVRSGAVLLELDHREQDILVDKARVLADTAKLELARIQNMAERGLATDRELEEAKQTAEVNAYEYDLAKVRLEDRIVRAPFDGQVTVRHVEVGQTVSLGQALVGVADISPLEVKLYLPEKVVGRLAIGQPVRIVSDVREDLALEGVVHRIAPVVDAATSTVKVTLRVEDPEDAVRVGSFVRARITTDVHEDAIAVPKRAIVAEAGASFVFVAEADSVRKVEVATGYTDDEFIEILSGVQTGEQVVTVGQGGLRDGSRVRDLNAPENASQEETPSDDQARAEDQVASLGG
jgi:membrane fusion protein (multidrug efflux system)